jgi:hypothetical protein
LGKDVLVMVDSAIAARSRSTRCSPDAARGRAFAVCGIALGLGGAAGFVLGGWLVTRDVAGLR